MAGGTKCIRGVLIIEEKRAAAAVRRIQCIILDTIER